MSLKKIQEVIIVHPINRVKEKIRPKQNINISFSNENINAAQNILEKSHDLKDKELDLIIQNLLSLWSKIIAKPSKENHCFTMFFIYLNRLDDISAIFKVDVLYDFIQSLKEFLEHANIENNSHQVIIQAHMDVINLAYQHKIESKDDEDAKNLKKMLLIAIEQNS